MKLFSNLLKRNENSSSQKESIKSHYFTGNVVEKITKEEEELLKSYLKASSVLPPLDKDKEFKKLKESGNGIIWKRTFQNSPNEESKLCVTKECALGSSLEAFKRQIFIQAKLGNHPRIVELYGVIPESWTMINEYMDGGDMEDLIKSKIPLTLLQQLTLASHVAEGMEYMHSKYLIHRDLAGRNVILKKQTRNDGTVIYEAKLTDFGQAIELSPKSKEIELLDSGPIRICSPEVLDKHIHSYASDVWSYGILLYILFAKERPYSNIDSQLEVKQAIIEGTASLDVARLRCEHAQSIPSIFIESLKRNPSERITFEEIVQRLKKEEIFRQE